MIPEITEMLCESMQCTCKKENDLLVSYTQCTPLAALDCQMLMSINYAENLHSNGMKGV